MVLTIGANITFGNNEIVEYSGLINISDEKLNCNSVDELKKYLTGAIVCKEKFYIIDKKIYNHIIFYSYIGIKLNLKYDEENNKTLLCYNDIIVRQCYKTIEVYFNYNFISMCKKYKQFKNLFYDDNQFCRDKDYIEIDIKNSSESNERFDMKIKINDNASFALECFENHHINKNDPRYLIERTRLLRKIDYEKDVKFIVVFWRDDILNEENFKKKFKCVIEQYNIHVKTKRDYCIEKLNENIKNKVLCTMIYNSYENKDEHIIDICNINEQFIFNKNMENKYLEHFESKLKNVFKENQKIFKNQTNSDDDLDFISDNDSQSEKFNETEEDFLNKFYFGNKLTFRGFTHYINGLAYGNFLLNSIDKFNIIEWFNNTLYSLIKSFENAYDNLEKLSCENKIFGLTD